MKDLEIISRSVKRRLFKVQELDSYPFLSGDTFRLRCDEVINNDFYLNIEKRDLQVRKN